MTNNIFDKIKSAKTGRWLAVVLCLILMAGSFAGTFRSPGTASAINLADIETHTEMSAADIYEANVNSTVGITTAITTNYWGYETTAAASGSGFIITSDGYILTNHHVIEDADAITVTTFDGDSYDAELIGYDESNDIAVLKVEAEDLAPVTLGDSDALRVGDEVLAIGNPLGELTFSLTGGRISALNREITVSSGVTMNLIQTDCAINSGNSGGALFNMYGEVIGITNAKYSGSGLSGAASIDNIGFAIPVSQVVRTVMSIVETGSIVTPYIGVSISNVSAEALSYGVPEGAAVRSVTEDSPAAAAGLEENDIIVAVNGVEITGSNDLVRIVNASEVGDMLTLSVYRQGGTVELTIEIGEKVQSALPEEEEPAQGQNQPQQFPLEQFPFDSFENFMQEFGNGHMS